MTSHETVSTQHEFASEAELAMQLESHGIAVELWGTGAAKTVGHLLSELQQGESSLEFTDAKTALRKVRVTWIDVYHSDETGNLYHLVEDRQEFTDGRTRTRTLESSLGEKLKADESADLSVARALSEELKITDANTAIYELDEWQADYPTESYPGLRSIYSNYRYAAVITAESFNREGYVEVQRDKTNFYIWELVASAHGI